MTFETNATRYGVKKFETIIGFDDSGEVVYSATVTFRKPGMMIRHEKLARGLGAVKIVYIINGELSIWYAWDGKYFVEIMSD